ncbi:MAG: cyanophycinase [Saprospirales bacterium]|nr:cyanophycinase [Saprospirales bacterium]
MLLSMQAGAQSPVKGSLVIVGGGLESNNKGVFQELIDLAGGPEAAKFAVIPSAGGAPVQSFAYFRSELGSYGINPENVYLIPVAMIDDDSTLTVDESEWKDNGNDEGLAALVRKCTAVWFTGGDQMRTTRTLINADGSQTAVLEAVWDVYRAGGVVGGSSAGAAIMSEMMIGGGTSLAALDRGVVREYSGDDFPADSGVLVVGGLGFFPHGVVDQHFNQRSRIGRLAVVVGETSDTFTMGFGVDENTALIYDAASKKIQVAGAGGVTVLDAKNARISRVQKRTKWENLSVSYLEAGDSFDPETRIVTPSSDRKAIEGMEAFSEPFTNQVGLLSLDYYSFRDLYTRYLMDNSRNRSVQALNLISQDTGVNLILRKEKTSRGFFSGTSRDERQYTVSGLSMDLIPVRIKSMPLNKFR